MSDAARSNEGLTDEELLDYLSKHSSFSYTKEDLDEILMEPDFTRRKQLQVEVALSVIPTYMSTVTSKWAMEDREAIKEASSFEEKYGNILK